MKSLSKIWNRLQFKLAVCELFDPPLAVQQELERQDYQFDIQTFHAVSGPPIHRLYTAITPDGTPAVYGNPQAQARYREDRRRAAEKVFSIA